MFDEKRTKLSEHLKYGGFIPAKFIPVCDIKLGNDIDNLGKKNYYKISTDSEYLCNNLKDTNLKYVKNSLNLKDRYISSYKQDFYKKHNLENEETEEEKQKKTKSVNKYTDNLRYCNNLNSLVLNKFSILKSTDNITFMNNIKKNEKLTNFNENSEKDSYKMMKSTTKDSYQKIENDKIKYNQELPEIFREKKRVIKRLNAKSDYDENFNCNPLVDKHLYVQNERKDLIKIKKDEQKELMKSSFKPTNCPTEPNAENSNNQNLKLAQRYEYDNQSLILGTKRSVNLHSSSTIHIPVDLKNNDNFNYQKLQDNPKSKFNDFFIKNNKTLSRENIHIRLPGFKGHIPNDINLLKSQERKFCLSLDKANNNSDK